jgi:hypothetical protein
MGPNGGFITGSDFLIDGGVTADYWFGELLPSDPMNFWEPSGSVRTARHRD